MNTLLLCGSLIILGFHRLLYGPFDPLESEELYPKLLVATLESVLTANLLSIDVDMEFMLLFITLLAAKIWVWIGEWRLESLRQQRSTHMRTYACRTNSAKLVIAFGFEHMTLCVSALSAGLSFSLSVKDASTTLHGEFVRRTRSAVGNEVTTALAPDTSTVTYGGDLETAAGGWEHFVNPITAKFGGRCRCTHGQRCICALKKEYSRSPSRETGLAASQQPAVSEPTNARSSVTVSQDDSNNLGHETNDLPLDRVMPCTPSSYTNSTPKDYLNLAQTMPSNGEDAQIVFGGSTMDDDFPSNLNTFQPGDHPLQHWTAASPLQPDFSAFIGPVTATSSTSWGNSNENFLTTVAAPSGLDSIPLEWTMTSRSDSSFPNMAFEEPNGSTMFSLPTDSFSGTAGLTDLPFDWTSFAPGGSVTVGSQAPSYTTVCPDHAETIRPVPSSDDTLGAGVLNPPGPGPVALVPPSALSERIYLNKMHDESIDAASEVLEAAIEALEATMEAAVKDAERFLDDTEQHVDSNSEMIDMAMECMELAMDVIEAIEEEGTGGCGPKVCQADIPNLRIMASQLLN
ncbi:hypothetical protein CNMCM6069_008607 [Aspergillus lentulus]|nr:hypothetical protein CNMCM6069_008607 [Aspergillus lentulus]